MVCRRMTEDDVEAAVALLADGFPDRSPAYWRRAFERLRERTVPDGRPRYGYVLADDGRLVGIILVLFARGDDGAERGNLSSWYVEPAYRGFSHLLLSIPLKLEGVSLVNISPAPETFDTIRAQGFVQYVDGTFQALAAVSPPVRGIHIRRVTPTTPDASPLLVDHARWGCVCFEVRHEGRVHPFVFTSRRFVSDIVPCAQLVYCDSVSSFVRFAGPLGRRLLRHGLTAVLIDADRRIPGLVGIYRPGRAQKFYRGTASRHGDLAYTELPIFGA